VAHVPGGLVDEQRSTHRSAHNATHSG